MRSGQLTAFASCGLLASGPQLINYQHPLNRNRLGWWRVMPGLHGGSIYRDLTGQIDGTFSFNNSTDGRNNMAPPGGYGSIKGSYSTTAVVNYNTNFGLNGTNMSFACWAYLPTTNERGAFIKFGNNSNGWGLGVGSSTFDAYGSEIIGLYELEAWIPTGFNFTVGWHHFGITITSNGVPTFYYDGRRIYTRSPASIRSPADNNCFGLLGYSTIGGGGRQFGGHTDDSQLWNRVLSDKEFSDLYLESTLGYPTLLNSRPAVSVFYSSNYTGGPFDRTIPIPSINSSEAFGNPLVVRTIYNEVVNMPYQRTWSGIKPPVGTALNTTTVFATGLQGGWLLNEGGGDTARELTGRWNASLLNSTPWSIGSHGTGLGFSTNSHIVDVGDVPVPVSSQTFAAAVWCRLDGGANNRSLFGKYKHLDDTNTSFLLYVNGSNQPALYISNGTTNRNYTASTQITVGRFNHIAFSFDNGTVQIYINGIKESSISISGSATTVQECSTKMYIGSNHAPNSNASSWVGHISSVLYWTRAVTQSEFEQLYREPFVFMAPPRPQHALRYTHNITFGSWDQTLNPEGFTDFKFGAVQSVNLNTVQPTSIPTGEGQGHHTVIPGVATLTTLGRTNYEFGNPRINTPLSQAKLSLKVLRKWGLQKPPLGAKVDTSLALTSRMKMALLFNEKGGQQIFDALTGQMVGTYSYPNHMS
jgi:hypothetical protein